MPFRFVPFRQWLPVLLLATLAGNAAAQPEVLPDSVDIRLLHDSASANLLVQVKLYGPEPFGGIFSALTVTVRYDAQSGATLGAGTSFCNAWSAFTPSPVAYSNGVAYRTYNGFGAIRLEDPASEGGCGLSLPVGTWFTITSIPVGGSGCTAFTLGNDAFTHQQNRDYYISMAGIDVTGHVVGGPVDGGTCPLDCLGIPGGAALPGTACDDGNTNTVGDTWSTDCTCVGEVVYDCPVLEANIGDACDDGNAETVNDVVTADCACVGTITYDCPALEANIGDACDDGNTETVNDVVTADCACVGTITYDCPALEANIGDACDDGNAETVNDVVTADCACVGTITYDCPVLEANIGDTCDDGNAETVNDVVTADCACVGTITYDCPALEANIGDACDDGNAETVNDVVTSDCTCAGTIGSGIAGPGGSSGISMSLFPNPVHAGTVLLDMSGLPRDCTSALVEVRDAQGRVVLRAGVRVAGGELHHALEVVPRASAGLYVVEVVAADQRYRTRLAIQ